MKGPPRRSLSFKRFVRTAKIRAAWFKRPHEGPSPPTPSLPPPPPTFPLSCRFSASILRAGIRPLSPPNLLPPLPPRHHGTRATPSKRRGGSGHSYRCVHVLKQDTRGGTVIRNERKREGREKNTSRRGRGGEGGGGQNGCRAGKIRTICRSGGTDVTTGIIPTGFSLFFSVSLSLSSSTGP